MAVPAPTALISSPARAGPATRAVFITQVPGTETPWPAAKSRKLRTARDRKGVRRAPPPTPRLLLVPVLPLLPVLPVLPLLALSAVSLASGRVVVMASGRPGRA